MSDGELRELAREEPQAVRAVAERADDPLSSWLLEVVEEENGGDGQ